MDEQEFHTLKNRVSALELEVFDRRPKDTPPERAGSRPNKAIAEHHLENNDLEEAGRILGIKRAHGGDEDEESYKRRLSAEVHGAEAADAVKPRPTDDEQKALDASGEGEPIDPNAPPADPSAAANATNPGAATIQPDAAV